jgi:hypothetical protein
MQILLTNKFVTFEYHKDKSLIFYYWTTSTEKVEWVDFQDIMLQFKAFLIEHKPANVLADFKDFLFIISESQQQWVDIEVNGTALENGLQKLAMIIPNDAYTHISLELVMMEDMASLLNYDFFQTLNEAKDWMFMD